MDVEQIALMTARFALQTLGALEPESLAYPTAEGDHLLWSHHGGWIFERPMSARWETYPRAPGCPACGEGALGPQSEEDAEALKTLRAELRDIRRLLPLEARGGPGSG